MIPTRYPAPVAAHNFSDIRRFSLWLDISRAFAYEAIRVADQPEEDKATAVTSFNNLEVPSPDAIAARERITGHDVVAFLSLLQEQLADVAKRHLHYGLTSSDLVDTALFMQLRDHAGSMERSVHDLIQVMSRWETTNIPRPGRTHGQVADVTTWGHQMNVYLAVLRQLEGEFGATANYTMVKSPGPTGRSPVIPHRGWAVAARYHAEEVPSTQVIPRDHLVRWAALYLRLAGVLENLAVLVRAGARSEVGELAEGATRVGSSAMPYKRNPIDSEKVCGLASVARGYFTTLAEASVLWEDRDLSNSSVERIAVPGLAATVEHMTGVMLRVMNNLQVNQDRMLHNARGEATMSNILQALAQDHFGFGPVTASEVVRVYTRWDSEDGQIYIDGRQMAGTWGLKQSQVMAWGAAAQRLWESQF